MDPQLTSHSAWIAWFPVLSYSTLYVGDLYKRTSPPANSPDEQNALDAEAMRLGSRALFFAALLSLFVNLTFPLFVSESAGTRNGRPAIPNTAQSWFDRACRVPRSMQVHLATLWAVSHLVFAGCMFATLCVGFFFFWLSSSPLSCSAIVLRRVFGAPHLSSPPPGFRGLLPCGPHFLWFVLFNSNSTYTITDFQFSSRKPSSQNQPHTRSTTLEVFALPTPAHDHEQAAKANVMYSSPEVTNQTEAKTRRHEERSGGAC
jgi:hypothetical protein